MFKIGYIQRLKHIYLNLFSAYFNPLMKLKIYAFKSLHNLVMKIIKFVLSSYNIFITSFNLSYLCFFLLNNFSRCVEPKPYVHIEKKENNQNHLSTNQPVQSTTSITTTTTTSTTTTTTTSSTSLSLGSVQFPDQNVRFVPCVQPNKCLGSVYDIGSGEHLTRYGVLPQCSDGMIRKIS